MARISFVQNVLLEQRQFSGVMEEEGNDRRMTLAICHFIRVSIRDGWHSILFSFRDHRGYALAAFDQLEAE